jgi:hypothetical protein
VPFAAFAVEALPVTPNTYHLSSPFVLFASFVVNLAVPLPLARIAPPQFPGAPRSAEVLCAKGGARWRSVYNLLEIRHDLDDADRETSAGYINQCWRKWIAWKGS